jgi:uncharacterized protein
VFETPLSIVQARVLGCLLEKERTVPDQYPLSLNAVVMACNQSTNREPVMAVAEFTIEAILSELKTAGMVRFVHPTSGRGVTKYKQVLDEKLDLEPDQSAVLCLLLLRGPQTSNELRTRAERLHGFSSTSEVEQTLSHLAAQAEPFVVLMERQPGQKEPRWRQLIADEEVPEPGIGGGGSSGAGSSTRATVEAMATRIDELEERVARLEAALAELL